MPLTVADLLDRVENPKRTTNGFRADCPSCNSKGALAIAESAEGKALVHCHRYGGGCSFEQIRDALGRSTGQGARTPRNRATVQPFEHLTLEEYAERKQLPLEFLKSLGLSTRKGGEPCVRIPYRDTEGREVAIRYRVSWQDSNAGPRFKWKAGSKTLLYGLWRLPQLEREQTLILVEGESDCQTLWLHQFPALGLPGAGTIKDEWMPVLQDFDSIAVVIEPDSGGAALLKKLAASPLKDRILVVDLSPFKDASALYLGDPQAFSERFNAALASARPLREIEAKRKDQEEVETWNACCSLAVEDDILSLFAADLKRRGVVGEERLVKLLYLILTSRLMPRPVSAAVKGPSSGGKSFTLERVTDYFPDSAYYALSAMSEHALIYDQEPLVHRILITYEAAGACSELLTYLIRSILSEGRVKYVTVEKTSDGMRPRTIERLGPTGYLTTTTAVSLHPENETRMLSIPVTDTREQTSRILLSLAAEQERPPVSDDWKALQLWLETGERRVAIPYAEDLTRLIPPIAVRLRRDTTAMLNLIRCHALLHRATRDRDLDGRILATTQDYAAVRELIVDLMSEGVGATVQPEVRETVRAVADLLGEKAEGVGATVNEIARKLKLDKSAASRRVKKAAELGHIQNTAGKGKPANIVLGDPLPDDHVILPFPNQLRGCTVEEGDLDNLDEWEVVA